MAGICSYGGYVPRYRLSRNLMYRSMGWMNPANIANAAGEKSVANFDEDSITMAVAAGTDALRGMDRSTVGGVYVASTTMPYKERLNAGIVTAALGLKDQIRAADFTGGIKCGTTALQAALEGVEAKRANNILVTTADSRLGKPASSQEFIFGDAGASVLVGTDDVIAEFRDAYSITYDFVDHYRGMFARFDRQWEDRWIRDVGFMEILPEAVEGLLGKTGMKISDFSKVIYPCHYASARKALNKKLGIAPEAAQENLQEQVGETGSAHAMLMLAGALENAAPGDRILLVSFGSGCDAMFFEVTENIRKLGPRYGLSGSLANRAELDNYNKYLVWRDILPADAGLRAEEDMWTRWSQLWRKRKEILGLWGSRCKQCGTVQYPTQRVCVKPECGATGEMEPYCFSDKKGRIASFTGDQLAATLNPPAIYGQVIFAQGGKYMFDFTDCDLESLTTGMKVEMSFRRKYRDEKRDIAGYFWKAVPLKEGE
ncbi:MAG: zinc ribbon domain-containing protein [Desulfobacteraceae bacterium]|nr:zinc ribbon domain-containing protein [Desulfobacteraceae bacterium]